MTGELSTPAPTTVDAFPIHPLADLIPSMADEEYARLREDVAANGLVDPITVYEGQVLDGRHRLRACEETGTKPRFVEYDGDSPAQFVLSHNLHRRHLSVSQRAMIATDFLPHLEQEAAQRRVDLGREAAMRQHHGGSVPNGTHPQEDRAAGRAGEVVGVSRTSVTRAKRVLQDAPDLAPQVRDGSLSVTAAEDEIKARKTRESKPENGHVSLRSVQRIAAQASALAMAIDAVNLTKSSARLSDQERAESLQDCKTGLKALNALANALGR